MAAGQFLNIAMDDCVLSCATEGPNIINEQGNACVADCNLQPNQLLDLVGRNCIGVCPANQQ